MSFNINQRFGFLNQLCGLVVDGTTPSLIVTGEGGLGKTYSIMQTIKDKYLDESDYIVFKGYSTARGLYNALYDNNGKVIVFDDCDSILNDKVAVNILKSALDSYEKREISWMAKMNKNDEYPSQFLFTGQIIFISNKNMDSIDDAILSRSLTVDLSMTPDEKIERMGYILPNILPELPDDVKSDALCYLSEKRNELQLNIRSLIITSKLRTAYPDNWKDLADYMISSK